jgi:hypothetical protein
VAKAIGSTQARVALVEKADPGVSADLNLKALIVTGAKSRDIAKALTR